MCSKCLQAVRRHYPQLPRNDCGNFLMATTCYPFGTPEQVDAQLEAMKLATDGSVGAAYAYSDAQMELAMNHDRYWDGAGI